MNFVATLFIIAIPFSAISKVGLLGNFDANLALFPLLLLLPLLAFSKTTYSTVLSKNGSETEFIRGFMYVMIYCCFTTFGNAIIFESAGLGDYGIQPLEKASQAVFVPVFLIFLVVAAFMIGAQVPRATLNKAMHIAFYCTCAYAVLQVASVLVNIPIYEQIWPFLEGARPADTSYISRGGRVSGPTQEPSDLARLIVLLFLPWIIFPLVGKRNNYLILLAIVLLVSSLSLTGVLIGAIALLYVAIVLRLLSLTQLIACLTVVIAVVLFAHFSGLFAEVTDRLANLDEDQSTAVRTQYNLVALQIILDYPLFGIGWSNEIFIFPERLVNSTDVWEINQNLAEGSSLTSRNLAFRLGMYVGIPSLIVLLVIGYRATNSRSVRRGNSPDNGRARFTFFMFVVCAILGGGDLTSFYLWVAPTMYLGVQFRSRLNQRQTRSSQAASSPRRARANIPF